MVQALRRTMALAVASLLFICCLAQVSDALDLGPGLDPTPIAWRDVDGGHRGWVALDEAAVLSPQYGVGGSLRNAPAGLPEYELIRRAPGAAFVRLLAPVARGELRGAGLSPVVYSAPDKGRGVAMVLNGQVVAKFKNSAAREEASGFAASLGLVEIGRRGQANQFAIYAAPDPWASLEAAQALNASGLVELAAPQFLRPMRTLAEPDDPYFSYEWNLDNTGQEDGSAGQDLNVVEVWDTYKGTSEEIIGIVDEELDMDHEDLVANILPDLSYDFFDDDYNPSDDEGSHGTQVAGMAAARGNNGIGVSGVAPEAALAGLRIPITLLSDDVIAVALNFGRDQIDIYNCSWGPADNLSFLAGPGVLSWDTLETGVAQGRGGLGSVFVWAAGNGGETDNVNFDGYNNNRYTIAVGAVNQQGRRATFSEKGACIAVCAPSSGTLGLVTTDPMGSAGSYSGNYSDGFNGTSAAAPEVAGVVALMLQANPDLTWREVKAILMSAARRNHSYDTDWAQNGAGFWVNHWYGFGVANAARSVELAEAFIGTGMGDEVEPVEIATDVGLTIPDQDEEGVSSTVTVSQDFLVEWVDVEFSCPDHSAAGDLDVYLVSPSGTESQLAESEMISEGYIYDGWRFGTARHFLESSAGDWTLRVVDNGTVGVGDWASWTLTIHGTQSVPDCLLYEDDNDVDPGDGGDDGDDGDSGGVSIPATGGPGGSGCVLSPRALNPLDLWWLLAGFGALLLRRRSRP